VIAIVTGSRRLNDKAAVWRELERLRPRLVIHGGARGADELAHQWALRTATPALVVPADWERLGKRAGPLRNEAMGALAERFAGYDDSPLIVYSVVVLAFPLGRSPGTRHCMKVMRWRGFEVREIDPFGTGQSEGDDGR
jgi:hypothetical protein